MYLHATRLDAEESIEYIIGMDQASKLEELRTIMAKVEREAEVPTDNPDVAALRTIVNDKIAKLEKQPNPDLTSY